MKNRIIIFIISLIVVTISIFGVYFYNKSKKEVLKELEIKVKTNGGVPYTWEYEIEDTSVVELEKKDSYVEDRYKELDGGPVDVIFTFKGLKKGTTTIILRYKNFTNNIIDEEKKYKVKVDNNKNITLY